MTIRVDNCDLSNNEKTWLSSKGADGDLSLTVESNEGYSANDNIVIGEVGEEETEALLVSSTSGDHTIVVTTALKHDHPAGTPIYFTLWNRYSIDVKASGGSYANMAGMPRDIEWDSKYSEHYYGGSTTDTYKYRFYNSTSGAFSSYSPEIAGTGFTRKSVRYMTNNVLKLANDPEEKVMSRDEIRYQFNAAQDYISAMDSRWRFLWKRGTAIPSVVNQAQYAMPSDMDRLEYITCSFDDGVDDRAYRLQPLSRVEFDYETMDHDREKDDYTKWYCHYMGDSTYLYDSFKVEPVPEHTYHNFYPHYYKKMTDLADDNDETVVPMPQLLEYWALSQIEKIRGNDTKSKVYMDMFESSVKLLKMQQRKDVGIKSFLTFRGRNVVNRFYGDRSGYDESSRINYW